MQVKLQNKCTEPVDGNQVNQNEVDRVKRDAASATLYLPSSRNQIKMSSVACSLTIATNWVIQWEKTVGWPTPVKSFW
jgi:hypothetical protein